MILGCFIIILLAWYSPIVIHQTWSGDFWEHASVINSFKQSLTSPPHPVLDVDASHAFFGSYPLILAMIGDLLSLNTIQLLGIAGGLNLILLISGTFLVSRIFARGNEYLSTLYTWLFLLFFWVKMPWYFSGFFHLRMLPEVLPYPSAFAFALALWSLFFWHQFIQGKHKRHFGYVLVLTSLVLTTHLLTYLFTVLAHGSLAISEKAFSSRKYNYLAVTLIGVFHLIIIHLWPYYSAWDLVLNWSHEFDDANNLLYHSIPARMLPLFIAGTVAAIYFIKTQQPFFMVCLFFLGIAIVYGRLSQSWSYGRLLSSFAFISALAVGCCIATTLGKSLRSKYTATVLTHFGVIAALISLGCVIQGKEAFLRPLRDPALGPRTFASEVQARIPPNTTLLIDPATGWPLIAYGYKLCASYHALAFVDGHMRRRVAITNLLNENETPDDFELVKRTAPDILLIPESQARSASLKAMLEKELVTDFGKAGGMAAFKINKSFFE